MVAACLNWPTALVLVALVAALVAVYALLGYVVERARADSERNVRPPR